MGYEAKISARPLVVPDATAPGQVVNRATADRRYATATKLKAQAILASCPQPARVYALAANAPTVTLSASGAATSITGGVLRSPRTSNVGSTAISQFVDVDNDPHWRYLGTGTTRPQYGSQLPDYYGVTWPVLTGGSSQARRWDGKYGHVYSGRVIEYVTKGLGTTISYRLTVDGQRVTENMATLSGAAAGQMFLIRVDFGTAGWRRIDLEMGGAQMFGGAWIEPTATLARSSVGKLKIAAFGDSITAGAAGVGAPDTWVSRCADLLGADEWANLAIGGSGFLNGTVANFRNRLPDIVAFNPDLLIYFGSYNDSQNTINQAAQDALEAEAEYCYSAIKTALPNCILIVAGCNTPGAPTNTNLQRANAATKQAAAAQGLQFIDILDPLNMFDTAPTWTTGILYPTGSIVKNAGVVYYTPSQYTAGATFDATKHVATSWIFGTGKTTDLKGDGNADQLIVTDGVHLTQDGHRLYERRFAAATIHRLTQLAAA